MPEVIDAVYLGGVFRPTVPPDLPEGAAVRLTVLPTTLPSGSPEDRPAIEVIKAIIARSAEPGP